MSITNEAIDAAKKKVMSLSAGLLTFNIGGFKINLTSLAIMNSNVETPGIGGFIANPQSLVQTLTQGARGIFCIGAVLTDTKLLLKTLKMCLEYIEALGIALLNDIYKTCLARVNMILAELYGITLDYFKTVKSIISACQAAGTMIKAVNEYKWKSGNTALDELFKRKDCEYIVANLLRCMISKMIQPYINKFENKVTQKIIDASGKISNKISSETSILNAMSGYVRQQANTVEKFSAQITELL